MGKKKKESDINVTAFEILQEITQESNKPRLAPSVEKALKKKPTTPEKNPAAVALGRLGGLKGGKARMASLSAKQRTEIAQKAARARWKRP